MMIKLLPVLALLVGLEQVYAQGTPELAINQEGYYPNAPKVAVLVTGYPVSGFAITDAVTKKIVFSGKPTSLTQSNNSSLKTQLADFSKVSKPGRYIYSDGREGTSYEFSVGPKIQSSMAVASLKAFYFQRVSMPLTSEYAGKWARASGHPDTRVIIHPSARSKDRMSDTVISSPGGWYDAGDYNKYIVNAGITMGTLLSAYEDFSYYFDTLNVNIPESGNALPDLLDEILYNLRWMLTMQDNQDGGVYHKCTNAAFDGTVMPGITILPRYAVQKSTTATLDFAAVMAQSSRILKKFDKQLPGLADSCLVAAKKAWSWSLKNPGMLYNQDSMNLHHQPKITTGAYGDRSADDEWFWAAAELFYTSGDGEFEQKMKTGLETAYSLPSWAKVHLLGVYTLLRLEKNTAVLAAVKTKLISLSDQYLLTMPTNAFGTVMGGRKSDFNWGSNSNAANQGILMINAWKLTGDIKYANAALANLDYLCGRNATGYHFVTGFGERSPKHPHHRPSEADGIEDPVPGLLAGGPNPGMQDKCNYIFKEPETAYVDDYCSYASNEIAINWNAPLVYLANAIEAIQFKTGYSKIPTKKK